MTQKQRKWEFQENSYEGCSGKYIESEDTFKPVLTLICGVIGSSSTIPGGLWKQQQTEVNIVYNRG